MDADDFLLADWPNAIGSKLNLPALVGNGLCQVPHFGVGADSAGFSFASAINSP